MKAKHQRLWFVLVSLAIMAGAATLILRTFQDNLVFFYTPTQWLEKSQAPAFDVTREMRVGGLVKPGSIRHGKDDGVRFIITDLSREMPAAYHGLLPSLFRDGQGVVAQGAWDGKTFQAKTILAKHDENYMPKEVVDQLKKSGRWKQ